MPGKSGGKRKCSISQRRKSVRHYLPKAACLLTYVTLHYCKPQTVAANMLAAFVTHEKLYQTGVSKNSPSLSEAGLLNILCETGEALEPGSRVSLNEDSRVAVAYIDDPDAIEP